MDTTFKIKTSLGDILEISHFDDSEHSDDIDCKGVNISVMNGDGSCSVEEIHLLKSEINDFFEILDRAADNKL